MRHFLLLLLLSGTTFGATAPERVDEHRLVRVVLEDGERATVFAEGLFPVDSVRTYEGLTFTGPPGRYAVVVIRPEDIQTLFVSIGKGPVPPGPDPNPPTPPVPPPDAFAALVKQKVFEVGDAAGKAKLAAVVTQLNRDIESRKFVTARAIYTEFAAKTANSLPPQWDAFGVWLSGELKTRGQTDAGAIAAMKALGQGLE